MEFGHSNGMFNISTVSFVMTKFTLQKYFKSLESNHSTSWLLRLQLSFNVHNVFEYSSTLFQSNKLPKIWLTTEISFLYESARNLIMVPPRSIGRVPFLNQSIHSGNSRSFALARILWVKWSVVIKI